MAYWLAYWTPVLAITISYPTSASGIIVLLKTPKELQYSSSPAIFVDAHWLPNLWSMVYEEMCEQANADVERFQLKATVEREILKKDAEMQMKLFSAVREMNDKVKRMKEQDTAPHAQEDKMPDAAQNALRYTTSYRVCRYIKIGCGLVLDTVAAYALFKVSKPFFF